MNEDLAFASRLADLADRITLEGFGSAPVRAKADGTPVTEADEACERALRSEIASVHPDDAIVGEEEGGAYATDAERRWIIDPIDGTKNYSFGIPIWGTLIALEERGEVTVGVASAPAIGERYEAARGEGARRNAEPIRVSEVEDLAQARLSYTELKSFETHGRAGGFDRLVRAVSFARGFGDFWGHMLVASGAVDVMVEPVVAVWDLAPLIVIVEEAGGRFTDLEGERRIDGGSVLSTNGRLHDASLEAFRHKG